LPTSNAKLPFNAMTTATDLRQRISTLTVRAARIEGMLTAAAARQQELTAEVSLAKGRLALGEEVSRVFEALQHRAHERSVGAFERLLSAILQDVLPEAGQVKLVPQYKSNTTWLDILLDKNGNLEDVAEANGGAVTNVVCAGLRFAALSRTDNRRLMILDEPDCWLMPERIQPFFNVISQVATKSRTQTFFITHHGAATVEGHTNIVRFSTDSNGKVQAGALAPLVADWPNNEVPGIRAIELINVRRHEHTVVPCFPGATAYIGPNNLGKSTAIVTAIKTVAYGESDDTLIRHGESECKVVLHLEKNLRIEWSRALKRNPVVLYELYDGDTKLSSGGQKVRNQAPDWVTDILGIDRVDNLDIQVGNQKSPVFLLNDPAPRRAQILSVGRESSHLKSFMKAYEQLKASDRETVARGELELGKLKYRLRFMAQLPDIQQKLTRIDAQQAESVALVERTERLKAALARLGQLTSSVDALSNEAAVLRKVPAAPVLHDEVRIANVLGLLERGAKLQALPSIPALPEFVLLKNTDSLLQLGRRIASGLAKQDLKAKLPSRMPETPVLKDESRVQLNVSKIASAIEKANATNTELGVVSQSFDAAIKDLATLKEQLGECPSCGAAFATEDEHCHAH
jgi:hypothetical protein